MLLSHVALLNWATVDDITIMGSSLEDVKQLKEKLSLCYEMSDLGEIQLYLGMQIC